MTEDKTVMSRRKFISNLSLLGIFPFLRPFKKENDKEFYFAELHCRNCDTQEFFVHSTEDGAGTSLSYEREKKCPECKKGDRMPIIGNYRCLLQPELRQKILRSINEPYMYWDMRLSRFSFTYKEK